MQAVSVKLIIHPQPTLTVNLFQCEECSMSLFLAPLYGTT